MNAPEANTKITFQKIDDAHQTSLTLEGIVENSNWQGGYAEFEVPSSRVGDRFTVEAEAYFVDPTKKDINFFQLRSSASRTFCSTLAISNNGLQTVSEVDGKTVYTPILDLEGNKWYRFKLDFNMADKVYDLTVIEDDGTQHDFPGIALGNPNVPTNEGFYVRVMMNTMGAKGSLTLDNVKLTAHYEMPQVTSVAFRKSDGTLVTETKRLPADLQAIIVYFNEAVTLESAQQKIKLYQGNKQTAVTGSVSLDTANKAVIFTPGTVLANGIDYTLEVQAGIVSALSGEASATEETVGFTTIGNGLFIEDADFKADGVVVSDAAQLTAGAKVSYTAQVANQTGAAKTVTVLLGLYSGGRLEQLVAKTVEVSTNGLSVTTPELTVPALAGELTCIAWLNDGLTTRKPIGAGDVLK